MEKLNIQTLKCRATIRKLYADLKPFLIDLEARYGATGRKQAKAVQRERLSEKDPTGYAIVQRTRQYIDVTCRCEGAEQSLADGETCCLAEVFLPNIVSKEEFIDVVKLLYRVNKHSLALPCHQKVTEAIVHKNMRMGIGMTGVLQATEEQKSWLDETYKELRKYDVAYSKEKGFNPSIKLATVK